MFWAYPAPGFGRLLHAYYPVLGTDHELIRSPRRARGRAWTLGHRGRLLPHGAVPPNRLLLAQRGQPACSAIAAPAAAGLSTRQKNQTAPTCPAWHEPAPSVLHLSWNPSYVYYTR